MAERPVAVVTGASRGIGRAIARRLAAEYRVIGLARDQERLDQLGAEIAAEGGEYRGIVIDLARPDDIHRALTGLKADVLVNNAGVMIKRPLVEITSAEWQAMVDVNVNALYHVTRELLPGMIARRNGHIVNIASIAGRSAFPGGTAYVATKHAVLGFSESLMLEVREYGVRVSVVMPGSVATDMVDPGADTSWMLKPEDVARAVAGILAAPAWALTYQVEVRAANPRKK